MINVWLEKQKVLKIVFVQGMSKNKHKNRDGVANICVMAYCEGWALRVDKSILTWSWAAIVDSRVMYLLFKIVFLKRQNNFKETLNLNNIQYLAVRFQSELSYLF